MSQANPETTLLEVLTSQEERINKLEAIVTLQQIALKQACEICHLQQQSINSLTGVSVINNPETNQQQAAAVN